MNPKKQRSQGILHKDGLNIRPAYYLPDPQTGLFPTIETSIDFSEQPLLTDQSDLKSSDINVIMKQYAARGENPHLDPSQFRYEDVSNLPTLETMFDIVNNAQNEFMKLPADIRRLMDNDPSQLENFISDANNADHLVKYGLAVPRKTEVKDPPESPKPTKPTEITPKE